MHNNERRDEILQIVGENGYAAVSELAKKTYASEATIRRDLDILERDGIIRRCHGGAQLNGADFRAPVYMRVQEHHREKSVIAKKAAGLITPGSAIFLDNSSTVQHMIKYLRDIADLRVFTNGAETAILLGQNGVRTVCTGGELLENSQAYVGEYAASFVRRINFDAVFFSSSGFDNGYVTDWSEPETQLRSCVIERSARRFFLCDRSKYGVRSTYVVCAASDVDGIVSES